MGGGLELALHCHYRTLSRSAGRLALPECSLGLLPGWGGTQLLPGLVGAAHAVTVIVANPLDQNRTLRPEQAAALGIADVLLDGADFLAESLRWAARVVRGEVTVDPDRGRPRAGLGRGGRPRAGARRREAARRGAGAVPGAGPDRAGEDRPAGRGLRRRGRGARRPGARRGAAGRALLVRPGAEAGAAAGRCAGPGAGPAGRHGGRARRRADGRPARAAVRPPAAGAGRAHRRRPGSARPRRRPGARRDRRAAGQETGGPGRGQPAPGPGDRLAGAGRLRRRRLRHRGGLRGPRGQAAGARGGRGRGPAGVRAGHQHLVAVDHASWRPGWHTRSGWSASTSSTRSRCCRWSRWYAPPGPTTRRWPRPSLSARSCGSRACWCRTRRRSWSTGC